MLTIETRPLLDAEKNALTDNSVTGYKGYYYKSIFKARSKNLLAVLHS